MADAPPVARSMANAAPKAPARKGLLGRLGDEFTQLRDEVFAGATNASASLQAMNASAAAHQLLQRQEMLAQLVGEGRGDSAQAQGLRTYIAHASQRLGGMAVDTAEAGALADAASRMTTRPQVRAVLEAKSFGEAWEVFKKDPFADKGTLSVEGDPRALETFLGKAGVDKVFLFDRSLLVAPEQAAQAQRALAALPLSLPGRNGTGVPPAAPVGTRSLSLRPACLLCVAIQMPLRRGCSQVACATRNGSLKE